MLNHPTLDQLKELKLTGMADAFVEMQAQDQAADLGHAEWLALPLDREAANRSTKRVNTRLRGAKLRHIGASVEDVDYRSRRQLDKPLFQQLATCKWIKDHRCLLEQRLSRLCRYLKARQDTWAGAPRSGLCPRHRYRRTLLHLRQLDSPEQP